MGACNAACMPLPLLPPLSTVLVCLPLSSAAFTASRFPAVAFCPILRQAQSQPTKKTCCRARG